MLHPHLLRLTAVVFLAMATQVPAQESAGLQGEAQQSPEAQQASAYFVPDWEPESTELYYGASFHGRDPSALSGFAPVVDLGLVDFHVRQMPRGGAEHLGALFFALEEEAQPGFPMNLEQRAEGNQCPMLMQPAADAVAGDSADADSHPGCEEPARRDTNPMLQGVR
jgi:hypothetical protein